MGCFLAFSSQGPATLHRQTVALCSSSGLVSTHHPWKFFKPYIASLANFVKDSILSSSFLGLSRVGKCSTAELHFKNVFLFCVSIPLSCPGSLWTHTVTPAGISASQAAGIAGLCHPEQASSTPYPSSTLSPLPATFLWWKATKATTLLDLEMCYKTISVKTSIVLAQKRIHHPLEQHQETRNNHHIYSELISQQLAQKTYSGEKVSVFTKRCWE